MTDASRILFQDDHLLLANKRAGELTVAGAGKMQKLPLLNHLEKEFGKLEALNRLDFETSGVVAFAKTNAAAEAVKNSKHKGWKKTYLALVDGIPLKSEGTISKPLPARSDGTLVPAETRYRVKEAFGGCSLLEVSIATGRMHQIRQHLNMVGHPLLLDSEYGDADTNRAFGKDSGYHRFFLHSWKLSLPHPVTGQPVDVEAPLPKPFEAVLKWLRSL